jgi:hypothetical protein
MKKKEFLTEAKRKAIIADKEKAILESFVKTFNKIKRLDENEISQFKVGDIVMWNPTFKMGKDYSVMYGAKAVVIKVIGGSNQLEVEWLKEPSNLKLVNGQMDGNYNINSFELANEDGVNANNAEDWEKESRAQQHKNAYQDFDPNAFNQDY